MIVFDNDDCGNTPQGWYEEFMSAPYLFSDLYSYNEPEPTLEDIQAFNEAMRKLAEEGAVIYFNGKKVGQNEND